MSDIKIEDFILEYDNFVPKEFCEATIEYYKNMEKCGFTENRMQAQNKLMHQISDTNTTLQGEESVKLEATQGLSSYFLNEFWSKVYPQYTNKYSILKNNAPHKINSIKLQKIKIGEGHHEWHHECGSIELSGRILTYLCYLNTVDEGGETEFLYYPKRIKAEQGKIILFPGPLTHTHRGNPPISNDKYVLVGWVEY